MVPPFGFGVHEKGKTKSEVREYGHIGGEQKGDII